MIFPKMVSILSRKGYTVYKDPGRLNIVGVRSKTNRPNRFDDELHVFFKNEKDTAWEYFIWKVTTDPGTYYLGTQLGGELGTAILSQGQYVDAYQIGLHRNNYKALTQRLPVRVIRDYDRDSTLDFDNGRTEVGNFGINIHRASSTGTTTTVDRYSAGCTVFANAQDFAAFMALAEKHRLKWGNKFTYTLIDFRAERRENYRRWAMAGTLIATGALAIGRIAPDFLENVKKKGEKIKDKVFA